MIAPPRLRDPILLFLVAALFATVALKVTFLPDWLRTFFMACAFIFGVWGTLTALNLLTYWTGLRIKEINKARYEGTTALAYAIKGLTMQQTELVARHDVLAISGILGDDDIIWEIRAPGGDIPWDFMADFLEKSVETQPYLWPVRKHEHLGWPNSEHLCAITTDLIKSKGWAEKSSGPYAAKLTTSLEIVASKFRVEV